MDRLKKILLLCLILVLLICTISIYRGSNFKKNNVGEKSRLYMHNYMNLKLEGDIRSEDRNLEGGTEGGRITRYEDKTGNVLRYRLIRYGETGKTEENYYFLDEAIYYTILEDMYDSHISVMYRSDAPADILYRTFKEVIMMDGKAWNYSGTDGRMIKSRKSAEKLYSLEDLNQLYEKAEPEK